MIRLLATVSLYHCVDSTSERPIREFGILDVNPQDIEWERIDSLFIGDNTTSLSHAESDDNHNSTAVSAPSSTGDGVPSPVLPLLHRQIYEAIVSVLEALTWLHLSDFMLSAPLSGISNGRIAELVADTLYQERVVEDITLVTKSIVDEYNGYQEALGYPGFLTPLMQEYMRFIQSIVSASRVQTVSERQGRVEQSLQLFAQIARVSLPSS